MCNTDSNVCLLMINQDIVASILLVTKQIPNINFIIIDESSGVVVC